MDFPSRLRYYLDKNHMTARPLAEKIGTTEVSISRYLHGTRIPNIDVLAKMAEVLHTDANALIMEETNTEFSEILRMARNAHLSAEENLEVISALLEERKYDNR